ncbi:unnamed protein product [Amoebophrya sp. A25]|nr:unnamed protein product [Amoebophrya sp. A25]|eukprot:GSA25T00023474001.1
MSFSLPLAAAGWDNRLVIYNSGIFAAPEFGHKNLQKTASLVVSFLALFSSPRTENSVSKYT